MARWRSRHVTVVIAATLGSLIGALKSRRLVTVVVSCAVWKCTNEARSPHEHSVKSGQDLYSCKKGKGHQNRAPSLLEPRVFF